MNLDAIKLGNILHSARMDSAGALALISGILLAWLLLLPVPAYAESASLRSYQLPSHGSLELLVPPAWSAEMRDGQQGGPSSLIFKPGNGSGFVIEVYLLLPPKPDVLPPSLEQIKANVARGAEDEKPQAVETYIPIQELTGTAGGGYYFNVTDRAPNPGGFKYMTRGMFRVDALTMAFTILTNDDTQSEVPYALTMLRSAKLTTAVRIPSSRSGAKPATQ